MNIELLERVKAHILEEPRRVDMGVWLDESPDVPCGTVGCIAGWALTLANDHTKGLIMPRATRLLDLTAAQAGRLFLGMIPGEFDLRVGTPEYAAAVAARIDRFIATGGAE